MNTKNLLRCRRFSRVPVLLGCGTDLRWERTLRATAYSRLAGINSASTSWSNVGESTVTSASEHHRLSRTESKSTVGLIDNRCTSFETALVRGGNLCAGNRGPLLRNDLQNQIER